MKLLFRKTILFALVMALGVASLPLVSVAAAGANDPTIPPERQVSNERLEQVWARQLERYERMGNRWERETEILARVQDLIDRAEAKGKDASAVQDALDAFETALQNAHPIYESINGIVSSHQGFDANGKVTDPAKAQETVQAMRAKFQEIRDVMGGTGKALHQAIKAFRAANPRSQPASTPASE